MDRIIISLVLFPFSCNHKSVISNPIKPIIKTNNCSAILKRYNDSYDSLIEMNRFFYYDSIFWSSLDSVCLCDSIK